MKMLHILHAGVHDRPGNVVGLMRTWIDHSAHRGHDVLVIGPSALGRMAHRAGLNVSAVLGAPHGWAEMAAPAIRHHLRERRPDAVACWSPGAFRATRAVGDDVPTLACLAHRPTPAEGRRLGRSLARHRGESLVVCFSATTAQAAVEMGVGNEGLYLLRPGVEGSWCETADRAALRASWGVTDDATPVVLALASPPLEADAERAGLALAMACEAMGNPGSLRQSVRLLCHPLQRSRSRAARVLGGIDMPRLVVQSEEAASPWRVLRGCDAVLSFGDHGDRLARAWGMAAGRAVVTGPRPDAATDIRHEEHGLIAKSHEPRDLARCIQRIFEDRAMAAGLGERAAARAATHFDPAAMAGALDDLVAHRLHTRTPFVST